MQVKSLQVAGDYEILVPGLERMVILNTEKRGLAVAERLGGHTWTVTADGLETTTTDRAAAVDALIGMAETLDGKTGSSTVEPYFVVGDVKVGLRDLP